MCGIIGIVKHDGNANVELYEGLNMLQHRGQDSAGMVTTDWAKFKVPLILNFILLPFSLTHCA